MSRVKNRLLAKVFNALPSLAERWGRRLERIVEPIPWTEPQRALSQATLAVITTGGVHLKLQRPFDMGDRNGDPTYREIPTDAPPGALMTTHDYYDHRHAERDLNLILPIERLRELVDHGALGALHPTAYSFMGHVDGPHMKTLVTETAPQVARKLRGAGVDHALLVPA